MIYLLLIVPHLLLMAGLLAFAYQSSRWLGGDGHDEGEGGNGGGPPTPPRAPEPAPSGNGLPMRDAAAPRRRLRVGERLADLHPRRPRRAHDRQDPQRAPTRT
ncbi:MAG: hypothetical protein ACLP01_09450 [Solirubrobacteraceae bacterium]